MKLVTKWGTYRAVMARAICSDERLGQFFWNNFLSERMPQGEESSSQRLFYCEDKDFANVIFDFITIDEKGV